MNKNFIIRNNKNATKRWRLISNILMNWIFLPLFFLQGLTKLSNGSNKEEHYNSLVYQVFLYVGGTAVCLSIILNIIHWLQPKWFENKKGIG